MTALMRAQVEARARGHCEYCRAPSAYSSGPFNVDHILPTSMGGLDALDNLAWSCSGCNGHKSARQTAFDPLTSDFVRLFDPRQDRWRDHFEWSLDRLRIAPLTAIGRASCELMDFNRLGNINLRRALLLEGAHPADQNL